MSRKYVKLLWVSIYYSAEELTTSCVPSCCWCISTLYMLTHMCLCLCLCHLTAGPPDVEQPCELSLQAWSPELSLYDTNVTSPCPDTEGCTLTLRFLHPVVPRTLTLWVTYISSSESPVWCFRFGWNCFGTVVLGEFIWSLNLTSR